MIPLLSEVSDFLRDLRLEFPKIFSPERPRRTLPPPLEQQDGRRLARVLLTERTEHFSRLMGVRYNRIAIKDQRTLWGSCSRQGNLNFNWRLILAPREVLDYLVIHELCHLLEMNHSRRFWAHVSKWCPDQRAHRRWLREHGPGLQRAGSPIFPRD